MRCERCAGLVVAEYVSAGATSIGCWASGEWRCINCGAVGISVPVSAHHVARGVAGADKGDGQRRTMNTGPRRS